MPSFFWDQPAHRELLQKASAMKAATIKSLMSQPNHFETFFIHDKDLNIVLDATRQRLDAATFQHLVKLAESEKMMQKIQAMFAGEPINQTEKRAVLHVALRCSPSDTFSANGKNVVKAVVEVRDRIRAFADKVRSGQWKGFSGLPIKSVVCIGIGGSYLGPEFVFEAMKTYPECARSSEGRQLRFLANVDPVDVTRAMQGLNLEETLCVVISKTFTTAETMLNAKTVKMQFINRFKDPNCIAKHMVAVSTNLTKVQEFGIDPANCFEFWDWVGGRFSVCSAVGLLPLALQFGFDHVQSFLDGCRSMDAHFKSAPLHKNLPVVTGLISFWNSTYLDISTVALLPYSQALVRFPAHVQQLAMESNGKRVHMSGVPFPAPFKTGEVYFGEPGTNGQHSFYQLLHQGRVLQSEFIGFVKSQTPIHVPGEAVSNHDELMSNFFAQPDALAFGKTEEDLTQENCPADLIPHRMFTGNRPSSLLLLPECSPFCVGQLLALYEHRTAVEGFLMGLNSFDQWGVELGKQLAQKVRGMIHTYRADHALPPSSDLPQSTLSLLNFYLHNS